MFHAIVSVLTVLCFALRREWLIVLALLCLHALGLVDYLYPATVPLWLTLSLVVVVLAMVIRDVFTYSHRRAADSVR